jgi:hypothetical protein
VLLAMLSACRGTADPPAPSGAPTVPGIVTVAARTQQVTDTVRAFGAVVGDGERPEVRDARTQLAEAEARAQLAAEQTARLQALTRGGVAPQKELEIAQAERATAHAAAERARAVLAAFGSPTPRAALAGEEAWVMAEVLQDDVARIRPDAAAGFENDLLRGHALVGRVEAAPAYVSTSTRTAPVRLRVRDPEKVLRPGMTGIASIAVGAPRTTVVVPAEAILQDGANCLAVLEEQPGHFLPRRVEPGTTVGGWTEVRTGLEPGMRVVTTGATSVLSATRLPAARE